MKQSVAIVMNGKDLHHVLTFPTHDTVQVMLETMSKIRTTLEETTDIAECTVSDGVNSSMIENTESFTVYTQESFGHTEQWNVSITKFFFES